MRDARARNRPRDVFLLQAKARHLSLDIHVNVLLALLLLLDERGQRVIRDLLFHLRNVALEHFDLAFDRANVGIDLRQRLLHLRALG